MIRKISYLILLSLLVAAFVAMSASAANKHVDRRVIDPSINKSLYYSFPNEHHRPTNFNSGESAAPLGGYKSSSYTDSPGLLLGHTWYDYQRNGSMRRMVGWGQHRDEDPVLGSPDSVDVFAVHFNWMRLMPPLAADRAYAYQAWVDTVSAGSSLRFAGDGSPVQSTGDWAGYVVLDVDNSNRAVLGGHYDQGNAGNFKAANWFDRVPVAAFYFSDLNLAANQEWDGTGTPCAGQEVIWPAMAYQEGDGVTANFQDTVIHIIASVSDADSPCLTAVQSFYYFRKVGAVNEVGQIGGIPGTWDFPPYVVDTGFTLSQDIFASHQSGKVVMGWTAARPDPGDCDTCSSNTGDNSLGNSQLDNDIYIQVSLDQGATWQPRINLTKRPHPDSVSVNTFWPYIDMSLLIDEDDDEIHVAWSGRFYEPDGQIGLLACRLFQWSEALGFTTVNPYGDTKSRAVIRTAHNAVWDQTTCNGGSWQMNLSKMSMSQCNGKHYITFAMFNDGPNNIFNDCAARAFTGGGAGAANGEIWVVVSNDGGVTWDRARNLTKSFSGGDALTACQPPGGTTDPCEADQWASSAPYGMNYSMGVSPSNVVVPDGGSDPGWYVDVQYINDPDAGGIPQNEGTWQQADVKWMRVACVEPIPAPNPVYGFQQIAFPSCSKHGVADARTLQIENSGNVTWNYTLAKFQTTGPTNWLTFGGFDGSILSGLNNVESGTVTLNTGGVVNTAGTIVSLQGGLVFTTTGAVPAVDTIPIVHTVADTCVPPTPDTISNNVFYLAVQSNGNFGNQGDGGVNMDFVWPDSLGPDCDSTNNVALYDGSPFVMWVDGTDTVANWSIFSDGWLSDNGFRPRVGKYKFESYLYEAYSTGVFSTNDSSIFLEKVWYSPRNYGTNNQGFFVQCVKLWSGDGLGKNNITVGEAIDWDMVADSGVDNASGFVFTAGSPVLNLIYQQGANYADGDTTECQPNDRRVGGVAARGTFLNGSLLNSGNIVNAMTLDNPTWVIPEGTFLPQQLYDRIDNTSGFDLYSSTNPDSEFVDLSMVITNLHQYNLGAADTLKMYYVFASSINTDPGVGAGSEFRNWINAGIAFDNARVCYADWAYPTHIAYQATSITVAGNASTGTSATGATATYNAGTNSTAISGSSPIEFSFNGGLVVTKVNGGSTAYHRVCWLSSATTVNTGTDTVVFLHQGEGVGAAKVATFAWYSGAAKATALAANFGNPASGTGLAVFNDFIQSTTNLANYTGWSPEVPAGNDLGVPRTVNQTMINGATYDGDWFYVKTTTDGGGGPFANGAQIDGFEVSFGCCQLGGNVNGLGGIDIADVTYLVAFAFKGGPAPPCPEEGNVNGVGGTDIADVTYLVAFAFKGGPAPPPCP